AGGCGNRRHRVVSDNGLAPAGRPILADLGGPLHAHLPCHGIPRAALLPDHPGERMGHGAVMPRRSELRRFLCSWGFNERVVAYRWGVLRRARAVTSTL